MLDLYREEPFLVITPWTKFNCYLCLVNVFHTRLPKHKIFVLILTVSCVCQFPYSIQTFRFVGISCCGVNNGFDSE